MSDSKEDPGAAGPPAKGGMSPKLLVILLAVNVLVSGIAVAVSVLDPFGGGHEGKEEAKEKPKDKEKAAGKVDEKGNVVPERPMMKLDTVTVRLRNPEVDRYARATFSIELGSQEDAALWKVMQPQVQDAILALLSDRSSEDVAGSTGLQKLKADVFDRAERILGHDHLHAVYISEFIIQ